jgi:hypothetical protein
MEGFVPVTIDENNPLESIRNLQVGFEQFGRIVEEKSIKQEPALLNHAFSCKQNLTDFLGGYQDLMRLTNGMPKGYKGELKELVRVARKTRGKITVAINNYHGYKKN